MRDAIPFSVIGGFLGAGKTTFLNRLMARAEAPRCALLVNDFGEIAIDGALVAEHAGDTITLRNGCVCCALGSDLTGTLSKILDRGTRPERIIVETSGVAQPGRVMDIARISDELRADGVIVIFNAEALPEQLEDRWIADTVRAQLAAADVLVPSRLDRLEPARRAAVLGRVADDCPGTPLLDCFDQGWQLFMDLAPADSRARPAFAPHAAFTARTVTTDRPVDPARLQRWLRSRADVYRIKGWVRLPGGASALLQGVGKHLDWQRVARTPDGNTSLVVIGRGGLPDGDAIAGQIAPVDPCSAEAGEAFLSRPRQTE